MMKNRGELREIVMQCVFQSEAQKAFDAGVTESFIREKKLKQAHSLYIIKTVKNLFENISQIDEWIKKYVKSYGIDRMDKVSLAALRVAVYEMMFERDIPAPVSINEAVRISKKYSTDKAGSLVNGILGNILRDEKFSEIIK